MIAPSPNARNAEVRVEGLSNMIFEKWKSRVAAGVGKLKKKTIAKVLNESPTL